MDALALEGGFADAPIEAAHAFRAAMGVMARPGRIETITGVQPLAPLSVAAGTLLLTLCDPETPVHLAGEFDIPAIRNWMTFHTGAPLVGPAQAVFAVGEWRDLNIEDYAIGTPEYPDRSATLIVEMAELSQTGATLTGPGIKDQACLSLPEVAAFQANHRLFPLGVDFFFTCDDRLAALPRTTQVR